MGFQSRKYTAATRLVKREVARDKDEQLSAEAFEMDSG
jgi:hypothetical protein